MRGYPCFSGYLLKCLLLCHLHLLRGESEGSWGRPNLRGKPVPPVPCPSGPVSGQLYVSLLDRSGLLRNDNHGEDRQNRRFWEPPAMLQEGSRRSESSIFAFRRHLALESILDHF